jgi:hypothetical protein
VKRNLIWSSLAVAATLLALAAPARAGGWVTVKLDRPVGPVREGEVVRVGFTLLQHGHRPTHHIYGAALEPRVVATHVATGERYEWPAWRLEPVGHYTAALKLPRTGKWEWSVVADPVPVLAPRGESFDTAPAMTLTVQPARLIGPRTDEVAPAQPVTGRAAGAMQQSGVPVSDAPPRTREAGRGSGAAWLGGILALAAAAGLVALTAVARGRGAYRLRRGR